MVNSHRPPSFLFLLRILGSVVNSHRPPSCVLVVLLTGVLLVESFDVPAVRQLRSSFRSSVDLRSTSWRVRDKLLVNQIHLDLPLVLLSTCLFSIDPPDDSVALLRSIIASSTSSVVNRAFPIAFLRPFRFRGYRHRSPSSSSIDRRLFRRSSCRAG